MSKESRWVLAVAAGVLLTLAVSQAAGSAEKLRREAGGDVGDEIILCIVFGQEEVVGVSLVGRSAGSKYELGGD